MVNSSASLNTRYPRYKGRHFSAINEKSMGFIDFSKQVILGNKVFYVDCFGLKFSGWVRPEHIKTFLRNCFIPNSTKKAVDKEGSTASRGRSLSISVINISFPPLDLKPRCQTRKFKRLKRFDPFHEL